MLCCCCVLPPRRPLAQDPQGWQALADAGEVDSPWMAVRCLLQAVSHPEKVHPPVTTLQRLCSVCWLALWVFCGSTVLLHVLAGPSALSQVQQMTCSHRIRCDMESLSCTFLTSYSLPVDGTMRKWTAGSLVLYMNQRGLTVMNRHYRIFLAHTNYFSVLCLLAKNKSSTVMCENLLGDSVWAWRVVTRTPPFWTQDTQKQREKTVVKGLEREDFCWLMHGTWISTLSLYV